MEARTDSVSWKDFSGAAALLLASTVGLGALALTPSSDNTAAVFTRPGTDFADVVAVIDAAGGAIVRNGGFANVVIAASPSPDFHKRLYAAGAWLVANPLILGGCTPSPPSVAAP